MSFSTRERREEVSLRRREDMKTVASGSSLRPGRTSVARIHPRSEQTDQVTGSNSIPVQRWASTHELPSVLGEGLSL